MVSLPVVVDADAIHAVAQRQDIFEGKNFLFTPHSYEFLALKGKEVAGKTDEERIKINMAPVNNRRGCESLDALRNSGRQVQIVDGPSVRIGPSEIFDPGDFMPHDLEREGSLDLRIGSDRQEGNMERIRNHKGILRPQPFRFSEG